MRQALLNLAEMLGELEALAGDVDGSVADLVLSKGATGKPDYHTLQKIDLLYQSLSAVRRVTENAVPFGPNTVALEKSTLVDGVLLESVRVGCSQDGYHGDTTVSREDDLIF
ncbi:hypothetical protein HKCCE4037_13275 [Rhodobacterales bacterium HKCCE4037]|nr:hypothetical protein [Rhodobacterales bacterium HKCCE4037]